MVAGNTADLRCKSGVISELVDWGVSTAFEDQQKCVRDPQSVCFALLNDVAFNATFRTYCQNQTSCTISAFERYLTVLGTANAPSLYKQCHQASARLFVQYMCKQPEKELESKFAIKKYNIYIEIGSAFLVLIFVLVSRIWVADAAKRYDEKNVTPSDYTLFFFVDEE